MTKKIGDTKPVLEFVELAGKYCLLFEERQKYSTVKFLQETFIILPQLCLGVVGLPDVKRIPDGETEPISTEDWNELFDSLRCELKEFDWYTDVFDPYDKENTKSVTSSMADDLASIYRALKPGVSLWATSNKLLIVWEWKHGFESHWGWHATGAFKALYFLLFQHIEGEYEIHVGMRDEH